MTREQVEWLQKNPAYSIVGRGGMPQGDGALAARPLQQAEHHTDMGALSADGTFTPRVRPKGDAVLVGKRAPDHAKGGQSW